MNNLTNKFSHSLFRLFSAMAVSILVFSFASIGYAQEMGVSAQRIILGQSMGLTGPIASSAKEQISGAKLYFDGVNKSGGIYGRKIELVTLDDKFDAKQAVVNANELIDKGVFSFFLFRGTAIVEAVLPLVVDKRIPMVAPSTGAQSLHDPLNKWVFNVRPRFQQEVEKAVKHLHSIGVVRIGILHAEDGFGKDALTGFNRTMQEIKRKPQWMRGFKRPFTDVKEVTIDAVKSDSQALVLIGASGEIASFIKSYRASGGTSQLVTISNNSSQSFLDGLGVYGRGMIITQAVPSSPARGMTIITDFRNAAASEKIPTTPAALEGFIAAKLMCEGLRRAGVALTRDKFVSALESGMPIDLGGIRMNYSSKSRTGSEYVDITIVGVDGKVIY